MGDRRGSAPGRDCSALGTIRIVRTRYVALLRGINVGGKNLISMADLRVELESDRPLMDVTLLSDGTTIYAARSADELEDVFRRGQGVFGIAVGPVQTELEGEIHELFPEGGEVAADLVTEAKAN